MLWFVVNTDLTITTEKLVELFATMRDYYMQYLYVNLDLPRAKVAEMKRSYRSPSQRRDAYLDLYATGHPCPSWRQVAQVLHGIGLLHQADVVESTYVQGTRINRYVIVLFMGGMGNGGGILCNSLILNYSAHLYHVFQCASFLKISPHLKSHHPQNLTTYRGQQP